VVRLGSGGRAVNEKPEEEHVSYRRHHVVEHAITVLDAYGLGDL